ncbi:MAG: ABC transporter permease subunit [Lachnospiraceae bacterium]|nr:ABC transporter permease subunit [Lachnospiraceae bacterium]
MISQYEANIATTLGSLKDVINLSDSMSKGRDGKIRIKAKSKSNTAIYVLVMVLLGLTVLAFLTFDYKDIDFGKAIADTLHNIKTVFLQPKLTRDTTVGVLYQLFVTFCLGTLSTIFGAILAFFCSLLCAKNIANQTVANIFKSFVALIRAIPTVLWVLIFAVSAGLGSVAAVIGLTFHSFAYLTKVYAEAIEEVDEGTIEALRASGANFWQIVFQAVVPASRSYLVAWTFMRFEINFTNAVAMGAAAGAGGIGFNLFMAGSFYFDLNEMGLLTYVVVIAVVVLEFVSTKIKAKAK